MGMFGHVTIVGGITYCSRFNNLGPVQEFVGNTKLCFENDSNYELN